MRLEIYLVLRSLKLGVYRVKKFDAIAEVAGIPCFIGGMEEIGVGIAVGLHFIMSTKNIKYGTEVFDF